MARSGSFDFGVTGDNIFRGAQRIVKGMGGKLPKGSKTGQSELKQTREACNMMLKEWQAQGVGLWLNREIFLFFDYRDGIYSLGPTGDHATLTLVETEIATAASSGASAIVVDSTTDMTAADNIGIELDDRTLQWTTIAAGGVVDSTNLNLDASLTDDVAVNRNVYTYTDKSQRPLSVKDARLVSDAGAETPMYIADRQEWYDLPNKDTNGTPSQVFYDRQLDSGILYIWPRPENVNRYMKLSCRYPIQDFDAAANDPDFPQEVYRAVKFNLAIDISHEYTGIDMNRYYALRKYAEGLFRTMQSYDIEYGSYFFESEESSR